jgi:hypothetical protein
MSKVVNPEARAGTVELDATVNDKPMYAYYAAGCCGLRSFYGFDGKKPSSWASDPREQKGWTVTPEEVITGIVNSGTAGCLMVLTDVYGKGENAERFKDFVERYDLGTVTIAPPVRNEYTEAMIVGILFGYDIAKLAKWVAEQQGDDHWSRPEGWYSQHDAVYMDGEFYQGGGRPKPANQVQHSGIFSNGKVTEYGCEDYEDDDEF